MPPPVEAVSEVERYLQVGKAISDPTRLRILQLVASAAEYPCIELETQVPVSKSTISHHVKVLAGAGLISVRREGKFFFYELRHEVLEYYLPGMLERLRTASQT